MASDHEGVPCPTYGVGDEVDINGFTIRLDDVWLSRGYTDPKWVSSYKEQQFFKKEENLALVFVYSVRNNSPLAVESDFNTHFYLTDGTQGSFWPYNRKAAQAWLGLPDYPSSSMPPGKWVPFVLVSRATPETAQGAAVRVFYTESEFDPTDRRGQRKLYFDRAQYVIDLGEVGQRDPIDPTKPLQKIE